MRKADLIAGLMGKPKPFDAGDGFTVHLRRLSGADRADLMAWYQEHKAEPGAATTLQHKLVALAVADPETGDAILAEKDAAILPAVAVDAISTEVAVRNGLNGKAGPAERGPAPAAE